MMMNKRPGNKEQTVSQSVSEFVGKERAGTMHSIGGGEKLGTVGGNKERNETRERKS